LCHRSKTGDATWSVAATFPSSLPSGTYAR
jgi:hypothetical protein